MFVAFTLRNWRKFCGLAVIVSLGAFAGCNQGPGTKTAKVPKVVVTKPIMDTVMDYQDFTGRLEAVKSIEIKPHVSGYVTKAIIPRDGKPSALGKNDVKAVEGELVKEGDLLFEIDPRPFVADLNQAEANLKVAEADSNLQEKNSVRAQTSYSARAISREDYETAVAAQLKSAAAVGAAQAMRDRAKLYVDYTQIKAPVNGRISRRFVDPGNMAKTDETVLTTIVTEDRMYAYFDVDERTYLELLAAIAPGQTSWYEGLRLPVMMRLANENDFAKDKVGEVDFVDNRVVATTGTVRMRGVFKNDSSLLKPGLFVRIRLPIGSAYEAIMIPDEAIQSDQERKYVWLVNAKNEVEYRSVNPGMSIKELRVIKPAEKDKDGKIKHGLTLEDKVIISGMQRAKKGLEVDADLRASPPPPHMPLVGLLATALDREGGRQGDKETRRQGDKKIIKGTGEK
jgi:membrane fusion protein, multidrug efflux system